MYLETLNTEMEYYLLTLMFGTNRIVNVYGVHLRDRMNYEQHANIHATYISSFGDHTNFLC